MGVYARNIGGRLFIEGYISLGVSNYDSFIKIKEDKLQQSFIIHNNAPI
jgi:hypothetical protein